MNSCSKFLFVKVGVSVWLNPLIARAGSADNPSRLIRINLKLVVSLSTVDIMALSRSAIYTFPLIGDVKQGGQLLTRVSHDIVLCVVLSPSPMQKRPFSGH